jgi:rubrerythrin
METEWASDYKDLLDAAEKQKDLSNSDPSKTHFITTAYVSLYKTNSYGDDPVRSGAYQSFILNGVPYYFLVYEFTDHNGVKHTAQRTYAQFPGSQVSNYAGNTTLEIAYTWVDGELVTMNTSYNLTTCADYKHALSSAEGNKILAKNTIFVIIGEVLIAALFVFIYIKKLKKYKNLVQQDEEAYTQKQQAEVSEAQAKAEVAQKEAQQKNRICAFCGSTVPDDEPNCPSCGSSTFE